MNIKMNVVCRKNKIYQNNTMPIHIRFTLNRQIRYISTGVSLPIYAWNEEAQQIYPDYPNAAELQFQIDNKRREFDKKIKRREALEVDITFDRLFERNGQRISYTIADYFGQQIERLKSVGKIASVAKYRFCFVALEKCCSINIGEHLSMA